MKDKPHIGFDLDGVIADWIYSYTKHSHKVNGTKTMRTTDSDIEQFSLYPWYQPRDEFISTIKSWAKQPNVFVKMPHIDSSDINYLRAMQNLNAYDISFITARNPPGVHDVREQTRAWLDKRGLHDHPLYLSKNKGELCDALGIDFFIDDSDNNIEDIILHSPKTVPVAMNRSYVSKSTKRSVPTANNLVEYFGIVRSRL